MGRGVSVVYSTHRVEPRFDWFAESLAASIGDADVEVIVVDGLHSANRTARINEVVGGRFAVRHIPAKPTPYNGPHRLTRRDYFAAASARNTGLAHAARPYVVFVDDASVLNSHMLVDVLYGTRQVHSLGNYYHLRILGEGNIGQTARYFPRTHWFDGQPLDQM